MVSGSNPIVHRSVVSPSIDDDDSRAGPSSISSLPMYTTDLDSEARGPSRGSVLSEKKGAGYSPESGGYAYDYRSNGSSSGLSSGSDAFSTKRKTSSFLSLPAFSFAFKSKNNGSDNNQRSSYNKSDGSSKKYKSIAMWLLGIVSFCLLAYPIISFFDSSSRFQPVVGTSDSTVLTADPLIYPDLESLFKPRNIGGSGAAGGNRQAPKKSPTDHTLDLSDKEMPAAAKGKRPGVAPGGVAGSVAAGGAGSAGSAAGSLTGESTDAEEAEKKDNLKKTDPRVSNAEFQNRNSVLSSLRFQSLARDGSFWRFGNKAKPVTKSPELVLVTGINPEKYSTEYLERVIENRKRYAQKWGYGLYVRLVTDFRPEFESTITQSPSWAKLSILRAAIHAFPESKHFWNIDSNAFIQDMDSEIINDLIEPKTLAGKIERDRPILRYNNIIKTYKHMSSSNARLIVPADEIGVSASSFILANLDRDLTIDYAGAGYNKYNVRRYSGGQRGLFAKSLLEYWNDPVSRSYRQYDRSENSALNHILQWHAVFLSRTAVVNGRELMSYSEESVASMLGLRGNDLTQASQLPIEEGTMSLADYEKDGLVFYHKNPEKRGRVVVINSCSQGSSITCLRELSKYTNLQPKKDEGSNNKIGNQDQQKQQAQAQEARAHAQAQAQAQVPQAPPAAAVLAQAHAQGQVQQNQAQQGQVQQNQVQQGQVQQGQVQQGQVQQGQVQQGQVQQGQVQQGQVQQGQVQQGQAQQGQVQQNQAQQVQAQQGQAQGQVQGQAQPEVKGNAQAQYANAEQTSKDSVDIKAQVAADIEKQKGINTPNAQAAADIEKQKEINTANAQVAADIAKQKALNDPKVQMQADIQKARDAILAAESLSGAKAVDGEQGDQLQ